jgi:16S rRNA (cytosine967-C5)-methyltransferase
MGKNNSKLKNVATNTRACIIDILILCNEGAYSNELLPQRLGRSNFSPQDRAMITNVVYTALRNQIRIDHALTKISKRPIAKLDKIVLNALRSVSAQILLGFDAHGVVNETVGVMPFAFKSFVNALSRNIVKLSDSNKFFVNETRDIKYSLPKWIVKEVENVFGEDNEEYLEFFNESPNVTLFPINDAYDDSKMQVRFTNGELVHSALVLESAGDISELNIIKNGDAIVVDQASQFIVNNIPIKNSDVVLDMCSAPGGKSFMMASRGAKIIANDISFSRMKKFLNTKERINATNVFGQVSDATKPNFLSESMDVVLVDAPCSGLGVLRRRADARNTIKESIIEELSVLQKEIIKESIKLVKPDGIYVYSVCTFSYKETVHIDDWLLKNYPEFERIAIDAKNELVTQKSRGYLLAPGENNDSMYFLILKKTV